MARKPSPLPTPSAPAMVLPAFPAAKLATLVARHDSARSLLINTWIDLAREGGAKAGDDECAKLVGRHVKKALLETKLSDGTVNAYAQGAMRAVYWNVQWDPSLHADKARKLPGSSRPGNTGKVMTQAKLDEKLGETLEALRLMKLDGVASDVLDAIRKAFPTWEEPAGK